MLLFMTVNQQTFCFECFNGFNISNQFLIKVGLFFFEILYNQNVVLLFEGVICYCYKFFSNLQENNIREKVYQISNIALQISDIAAFAIKSSYKMRSLIYILLCDSSLLIGFQ